MNTYKTMIFALIIVGLFLTACTTTDTERSDDTSGSETISSPDSTAHGESASGAGDLPVDLGTNEPEWAAEEDVDVSDEEVDI